MANGLYTNSELVDTIIADLNRIIKEALNGQYIEACCHVTQAAQKLVNLRTNIDKDLKSRDNTIENLKRELRAAGREIIEVDNKPMKGEQNNGSN